MSEEHRYPSTGAPRLTWVFERGQFHVFITLPERKPCGECGGPEGVMLDVGTSGYAVGTSYKHDPSCKALRCEHGVLWSEGCDLCDAADAESEDIDDEGAEDE